MQDRSEPSKAYRPDARDYRYVEAVKVWTQLAPHQSTRGRLAQDAGIPANKLAAYEAHPGRMAWVRAQLSGDRRDDQWERLVDRAYHRAMDGKIDWALFFARATARFGPGQEGGSQAPGGTGPTVVLVNIPRPAELPPAPRPVGASSIAHEDILDLAARR